MELCQPTTHMSNILPIHVNSPNNVSQTVVILTLTREERRKYEEIKLSFWRLLPMFCEYILSSNLININ